MRKKGVYISDKRLKFKEGSQKEFIRKLKEKSRLSWKDLARKIGISEYTLRVDWQKERCTLPYQLSKSILKRYPFEKWSIIKSDWIEEILPKNWGQSKAGNQNKKKINIPLSSEELANLLGSILGDGHVGKKELTITSEFPYEKKHLEYLQGIIKDLFGVDSRIFISYTNKNTIVLDCYSLELITFLEKNGLVVGNKIKNKASFPKWIFKKKIFIYGALRGLFDTDGGICRKQKGYRRAIIEFQTNSPYIRKDILVLLRKAGFTSSKSSSKKENYNIRIQNQKEVCRFFNLIGSSNPRNIMRYKHFIKYGEVPSKKKIAQEILNFKGKLPFKLNRR